MSNIINYMDIVVFIFRIHTKVKQGRLEVFPVPVGNFYQTFIIIMRLFHLLKGRLNMPIITALLLWIANICRIHLIDPLNSTKIFLVRQLETPPDPIKWPKCWKGRLRKLAWTKYGSWCPAVPSKGCFSVT